MDMVDGQKTKIGPRIDESTYKQFVSFVEEKHNRKDGVLALEIERALRRHMDMPEAETVLTQVSNDLQTIKDAVGVEADGGALAEPPTLEPRTHTQSDNDAQGTKSKPPAKATESDKVEYLIDTFLSGSGGEFTISDVSEHIRDEYGFGDRTVRKYRKSMLERINDEYELARHPNNNKLLAWGDGVEAAREKWA